MQRFKKILVYESTATAEYHALRRAAKLAKSTGAALKVVDVIAEEPLLHPRFHPPAWLSPDLVAENKRKRLETQAARIRRGGTRVDVEILHGKAFVEVIREVLRNGHDLVMKTVHQKAMSKLADPAAMDLLRNCPCPVELVRPPAARSRNAVLACVDPICDDAEHEEVNRKVIELAASLANWEKAQLHVVHAWHALAEGPLTGHTGIRGQELEKYIASQRSHIRERLIELLERCGCRPEADFIHLAKGEPGAVIPRIVRKHNIDLVVMGSLARSGIAGFLIGNTAERVVGRLECSLLAVKPGAFETPVKL